MKSIEKSGNGRHSREKTSNWGLLKKETVHGHLEEGYQSPTSFGHVEGVQRGKREGRSGAGAAASAPQARRAQGLADRGAPAGRGVGGRLRGGGGGVHYVW